MREGEYCLKKQNVVCYIVSYFFTFMIHLSLYMTSYADKQIRMSFISNFHFSFSFFFLTALLSVPVFVLFYYIFTYISKIHLKKSTFSGNMKKVKYIIFFSIFLTGLLMLITYYPGNNLNDTMYILSSPIGKGNQFPRIYSLLLALFYRIFMAIFHSPNFSFFLMEVGQLCLVSAILTYAILWFYRTFQNKYGTIFLTLYFSVLPIFSNYHSVLLRDPIFAICILLSIIFLYEIIDSKGKWLENDKHVIWFILVLGSSCLVRNNGIYASLLVILILWIWYKKYWKQVLFLMVGVLLVGNLHLFLPKKFQSHILFQEGVAVPIQQLAYTLKYEDLKESDKKFLNQIMPNELMKFGYHPFYVDRLKWNDYFNNDFLDEHKGEFMKVWWNNLGPHFEGYVKAYLYATYDLWSIQRFSFNQSRFLGLNWLDPDVYLDFPGFEKSPIFPKGIQQAMEKFYEVTTIFVNNATLFWIAIFFLLVTLYRKEQEKILLFVPLFSIWFTLMLAVPMSEAFRYMCYFGYCLPFVGLITFYQKER